MLSDSGHLIFTTGNDKEIRFQTSESGRVKVNNEDLTQLLSQVNFHFDLYSYSHSANMTFVIKSRFSHIWV